MRNKCKQLLIVGLLFTVFQISEVYTHDHYHHAQRSREPPAFKYSREPNVKYRADSNAQFRTVKFPEPVDEHKTRTLWIHAMGSTLLISAAPFFILFFVPLDNTEQKQPLLKVLLAFASGGLLGDAFLHLIPHAAMAVRDGVSHSHSHSHHPEGTSNEIHGHDMSVGLWVLAGIVTFLLVEKCVRILKGGHAHSHALLKKQDEEDEDVSEDTSEKLKNQEKGDAEESEESAEEDEMENEAVPEIKVAGYLNLAADFSHNFTDGLAIGSSYLAGNTIGVVTTITILLHEVPHEIGDFAILLQSGVSRKNAMLLQLTTALGAVAGTAISLLVQDSMMATSWILPFTAGGFIYIALVSVIPELLDEEKPSFTQTVLQVIALLTGVYLMVLIADFE